MNKTQKKNQRQKESSEANFYLGNQPNLAVPTVPMITKPGR